MDASISTRVVPHYGSAVTGAHRYPRPDLEERFDSAMTDTNGARLFGLRRVGKSSEALACRERLAARPGAGPVVYIDTQGFASEARLLMAVLEAMPAQGWRQRAMAAIAADNSIAKAARDALAKVAGTASDVQAYFVPIADAVERALQDNDRVVLAIDEFPWLCRDILESDRQNGRHRVDQLLAMLRRWRGKGMRMMLLGSIGMSALGRQHGLDLNHLNDLMPLDVPPLSATQAQELVQALAHGSGVAGWTDAHTAALLDETVAPYPSLLQRGFLALRRAGQAVPVDQVADIFEQVVRPGLDEAFYSQFDRRQQAYRQLPGVMPALLQTLLARVMTTPQNEQPYPVLRQTAADALARAAPAGAGAAALEDTALDADLGDALAILREDGFLSLRAPRNLPSQWRPASGLVTAWWQQRRGGG